MNYNLTEKLAFDDDPIIIIKDEKLTVNSDAEVVLKIMDILENEGELKAMKLSEELLFNEADQEAIKALKLKMPDFIKFIKAAISLAIGEDPDSVEQGE